MEPNGAGERHNVMLADTATIRTLGRAYVTHAADLAAVAAALRAIPSPPDALGPVGDRFLTAFTAALSDQSNAVAALGERTQAASRTAAHNAASFDAAGDRAAGLLPQV
ncbi:MULTISPECIES: hypothetical protein [Mycolicibacterium]|nr:MULTISPECIES: hypothetical protein [Mycolicibacterium]